jgi:transposase
VYQEIIQYSYQDYFEKFAIRVVKCINEGGSKVEAAWRFDLGRHTVYRYLAATQNGTLTLKIRWGHWRKLDPHQLISRLKIAGSRPFRLH